jgi:hypothetical protein
LPLDYPLRPNHSRSVEILGDFTDELAACLVTKIALFQSQGDDPITVFINSVGGSVRVLEILHGMLRSVDLEQKPASFITVAIGTLPAPQQICFASDITRIPTLTPLFIFTASEQANCQRN